MRAPFLLLTLLSLVSACGYRTPLTLPTPAAKPATSAPSTAPVAGSPAAPASGEAP